MDYNFNRKLHFKTEVKYKNLYQWAITEHDQEGTQIGRDLIPWPWGAYFTATACDLNDTFEKNRFGAADEGEGDLINKQIIRVKLRSGYKGYGKDDWRVPVFSMFGTDRYIDDITLEISSLTDNNDKESCKAWGIVSYTSENDFRDETTDDCMGFVLNVSPEKFARYAQYIREKSVSVINFSVNHAHGFYSDWSPSISTSHIKILVRENQQEIETSESVEVKFPILGEIGEFRLWFGSHITLERAKILTTEETDLNGHPYPPEKSVIDADEAIPPQAINHVSVNMAPLKRVLWVGAALLALIFLRLLAMN